MTTHIRGLGASRAEWSAVLSQTMDHNCAHRRPTARSAVIAVLATLTAVIFVTTSCSNSPNSSSGTSSSATSDRPAGPAADLSQELIGSRSPFIGASVGAKIPPGYVEQEFAAAGNATSYRVSGPLSADGRWTFEPDTSADYRTRVIVRRPADPATFSGTVVVEWLNVSGGLDANPDYSSTEEEILRQGHAWVGVSAQLIGVQGGPVLVSAPGASGLTGKGLVAIDPERYGSLVHPGDGYSFDIFTQVARALRQGGAVLGGEKPKHLIAAGESQSAIALTTYYNGVQPLTEAFDGFFVHSRASVALPLVDPGKYADLAGSMAASKPTILRTDLRAPVLELQAESDVTGVLRSIDARQDDTDNFRLWEVAGTSHADAHLLGALSTQIDCGLPINDGPMHLVAKAALRALDTWIVSGTPPPEHPRLATTAASPVAIARDSDGIAIGGIRTPQVDVPTQVLSGEPGPNPSLLCILLGSTRPLPAPSFAERYGDTYVIRFETALNAAVMAGVILQEDTANATAQQTSNTTVSG